VSETRLDAWPRRRLRDAYRLAVGLQALVGLGLSRRGGIRVFYGGARAGDIGGPLVKVKRLRERFPEHRFDYNLVYALSNAPYLPGFALRAIKARGIPIVANQNGVFYPAWYGGDWRAMNAEMAAGYHLADHVFWQSEFCRRAADRFLGERQGPGEVLYNAIDTGHFKPADRPRPARPFAFLVAGKIDTHLFYRLQASLEGLAVLRRSGFPARLTVAGWMSQPARARADELARDLGIDDQVIFTGPYAQSGAPGVFRDADAYLMLKHNDPCPSTVIEAMACGLPVVYSKSGGVAELVGPDAGVGVPCAEDWERPRWPDAEQVAAAMRSVMENRDRMSVAARRRAVERFDIGPWIERHRAVFASLVAARSAARVAR
jgi:glycosyltransferase involved in cell wall biosynthesis